MATPIPGLPPGITLSPAGVLSGIPTTAGVYQAAFMATDAASQTATAMLTLTVVPGLVLSVTGLPGAVVGQTYNFSLTATGGTPPYQFTETP